MTKAEELVLFQNLVRSLPDGYVRDILTESEPFIADAMRSDLAGHQPVSGLLDAKRELLKEIAECERALSDLTREISEKNRDVNRLDARMAEAKAEITVLARAAGIL
jgi:septal ring factor EnvC (AmiA/AmiB activator)